METLQTLGRFSGPALHFTRLVLLAVLAGAIAGCGDFGAGNARSNIASNAMIHVKEGRLSPGEIETVNRAFADRYLMRISTACDLVLDGNQDPVQCREVRELRARFASNIYDIVTEPDPYMQTLNLTVVVTLQTIQWVEEDTAHKVFGERGTALANITKASHADVMELAHKLFSPEQLNTLDELIRAWRVKNPDLLYLSHARFADFLDSSEWGAETRQKATGLFAEIDRTRQSVDDARALGERTLYLAKRMPLLMQWQTETALDSMTASPAVARALDDFHVLSVAADRIPATIDAQRRALVADADAQRKALVADAEAQRKAIFAELDQRQPALDATVKNVASMLAQADTFSQNSRSMLAQLQTTSASLQDLTKDVDKFVGRFTPAPAPPAAAAPASSPVAPQPAPSQRAEKPVIAPSGAAGQAPAAAAPSPAQSQPAGGESPPSQPHGFDIRDYTVALKEASQTARDLNTALLSTDRLMDSPAWQERITEINSAADGRVHLASEQSQMLVNSIFHKVYIVLGAFLIGLVLARVIGTWILKVTGLQKNGKIAA